MRNNKFPFLLTRWREKSKRKVFHFFFMDQLYVDYHCYDLMSIICIQLLPSDNLITLKTIVLMTVEACTNYNVLLTNGWQSAIAWHHAQNNQTFFKFREMWNDDDSFLVMNFALIFTLFRALSLRVIVFMCIKN